MHSNWKWIAAAVVAAAPAPGLAAEPRLFTVVAQPLPSALIAFAVQANISLGAEAARNCRPTLGINGRFTVEEGLRRLLAGTGCGFRMIDARTAVIVVADPAPTPRAAPPAPPLARTTPMPSPQTVDLDEVIVTSPKRTLALSRAPYAVSAVDGQALIDGGQPDTAGVALKVAGMTVTNLGPGRDKVFLRGLADGPLTGRTQSVVGIYLDDARILYNAPDPDLRLTDVERVEVLRGPQGTLYGAGSIGGVMQIITRSPRLDHFGGFLSGSAMVTKGGEQGSVIEGAVNAPLIENRLGLRVAAYREMTGGYIDDPGQGLTNLGAIRRQGLRASVLYEPTQALRLRLTFVDQGIRSNDSQYSETQSGPFSRALALREPFHNDFDGLTTAAQADLGWATLRITNALQGHDLRERYDATLSLPQFQAGAAGPAAYDEHNHISADVSEASLSSRPGGRLTWLAGLFLSEYTQVLDSNLGAGTGPIYAEHRHDDIDEHSAYGEATWQVSDRLRLTLGGRAYQLVVITNSQVRQPAAGPGRDFAAKTSDHGFAPKAVVEYDVSANALAYLQATEGYRAGGFNTSGLIGQLFSAPGAGAQPRRRFQGDELLSYEAGLKLSWLDGRLRLRAAAFHAIWQNVQSDRLLPNGLPFTANVGDGRNTGVELEAGWRGERWTVQGNALFNHPELSRPDPSFPIPIERGLPGVADAMGNLSVRYSWPPGARWTPSLGLDLGYVGRSILTFDSTLAPRMGGYLTSRVQAVLAAETWQASFWIDNPMDRAGDTFAFGNPFRLRQRSEHTPQRPVNAGVTISRSY